MKAIKKTKISNIPKTEGAVVDSVTANVDQRTNAPSIRAILEKIQQVASNIVHAITADRLKTARKIKLTGAVSGEASFDGSKDVTITTTQANIAILEGKLAQDNDSDEVNVPYPEKFNKQNCVVISYACTGGTTSQLFTVGSLYDSRSYIRGGLPMAVTLRDNDIAICAKRITMIDGQSPSVGYLSSGSMVSFKYRVILMKICEEERKYE